MGSYGALGVSLGTTPLTLNLNIPPLFADFVLYAAQPLLAARGLLQGGGDHALHGRRLASFVSHGGRTPRRQPMH